MARNREPWGEMGMPENDMLSSGVARVDRVMNGAEWWT